MATKLVWSRKKKRPKKEEETPKGSIFWLVFWILVCWPIALIYALIRRW